MTSSTEIGKRLQVTCQNCSLSTLCLPRGLHREDIERIGRLVNRKKTLQRGEYLYHKGEPFRGIIAIKAGTAKVVAYDDQDGEYIVGVLLPGELLGFDGLASNRHSCSAVALETLSYCELAADQLDALCHEVPNLLRELFRHASARLEDGIEQAILHKKSAEARVALFLLDFSERLRLRGFSPHHFTLTLTRQDIGNYLGLALETVSRILSGFQAAGLIAVRHRQIRVADLEGLRSVGAGQR
ncbi:helix-turn-helix domain-containing protein [Candidatus Methylocalor cossyra]|uniref:Fumarate and nitrate reduction regulatory protein n=1 Tax=Candidatus Methylocalor cossyra TaxID=3108543 RepID=A0ABM9NI00_9GAMM